MKTIVLLFFTCVLSLTLRAADPTPAPSTAPAASTTNVFPEIKLATGEVLKNVTYLSQTPTHVTFRVGNGMKQVDKRQLPAELQTRFPYDAEAAERRKAALAEAEAKRVADLEAKKAAAANATTTAAAAGIPAKAITNKYVKNGVRISFSSDTEGSGPMITLVNDSGTDQSFAKTEIMAKMMDDRTAVLRAATHGERLESDGKIVVIGDILNVRAHERLEFRGYFVPNPRVNKHSVADVFWAPTPAP